MTQKQNLKEKLDLYSYMMDIQNDLEIKLKDTTVPVQQMILTELAMWCLKNVPPDPPITSAQKSKIIRSFFRRFYYDR